MVQCQNFGVLSKLIASAKVFFGDKDKQNSKQHLSTKMQFVVGIPGGCKQKKVLPNDLTPDIADIILELFCYSISEKICHS